MTNPRHDAAQDFAERARAAGYQVWIAQAGHYGFYTNDGGERVVSFAGEYGAIKISGNCTPSTGCGTGWQIGEYSVDDATPERLQAWFDLPAPHWANPSPTYTTREQHLATYAASSKYTRMEA